MDQYTKDNGSKVRYRDSETITIQMETDTKGIS